MNIEILQPKPFDLVDEKLLIAGNAVGFEATLSVTVTDGHAEVTGIATAGSIQLRQFQASINVPASTAFQLDRLFVQLADDTAGGDEAPIPTAIVPVLFGPRILPNYSGFWVHTVEPGDTLSGLATQYYQDASQLSVIQRANQHLISDPNLIFVGQELRIPRAF